MPNANLPAISDKQSRFIACYVKSLDPGAAALEAGYTSVAYGYNLLRKPHIRQRVEQETDLAISRAGIDMDAVLHEIQEVAFSKQSVQELSNGGAILTGPRTADKLKALFWLKEHDHDAEQQAVSVQNTIIVMPSNGRGPESNPDDHDA